MIHSEYKSTKVNTYFLN